MLSNRIRTWRQTQNMYMPAVSLFTPPEVSTDMDTPAPSIPAEAIPLHLPSSLPVALRPDCKTLISMEYRLRYGQCDDNLAEIRRLHRVLKNVTYFKNKNITGTGGKANTRARALYDRFLLRVKKATGRYRAARVAIASIMPVGDWSERFQVLDDGDIRGPGKNDDESEGHYEPSWIWLVPPQRNEQTDDTAEAYGDSVRVEWAKTKARAMHWGEECHLLVEEMRRVLQALESKASIWDSRRTERTNVSPEVAEGLSAYAAKQAWTLRQLALVFAKTWVPFLSEHRNELSDTMVGSEVGKWTHDTIVTLESKYSLFLNKDSNSDGDSDAEDVLSDAEDVISDVDM